MFLEKFTNEYDVRIQYHDVSGVLLNDYRLGPVLMKYYSHNNEFCRYIKGNKKCGYKCYLMKHEISKCTRRIGGPFYGSCHLGMEEYIFPVKSNDHYIGYFTVGEFYTDREKKEQELKETAKKWGFDENVLIEKFFETAKLIDFDIDKMAIDMNIIANSISMYISQSIKLKDEVPPVNKDEEENDDEDDDNVNKNKNYVVNKIKEYLIENYCKDVSLEHLAQICHCNSSYLSYVFKKKTGQSITEYINNFRINKAKYLLFISNMTITQVSYDVGYNDSGYFSRVFKKSTGMSPESFRKNMKK